MMSVGAARHFNYTEISQSIDPRALPAAAHDDCAVPATHASGKEQRSRHDGCKLTQRMPTACCMSHNV
jgi:hypothetical protein